MRIISGLYGGRKLFTLSGRNTRPTADRVKEAIFSVLSPQIYGATVLDAFAGSAALGLEALSRGAAEVWLTEENRAAAEICAKNITLLGAENCRLLRGDCLKLLPRLRTGGETRCFDIIFVDPPYNVGLLNRFMQMAAQDNWLAEGGLLVAETTTKNSEFSPDDRWMVIKSSAYGDTTVHYCQLK